ncbi:phosphoribosyltransferase [Candidatus Borrarchaeum sp.]|uniref:phosphoribosyltransferase n=1 Tax=Candidatus Borrarchaeum sp. TaxID=2846742 RepID=UPI00257B6351|nr:phosphoribosyltransferase family protein [Candidatus Borrarchaeum sp.]
MSSFSSKVIEDPSLRNKTRIFKDREHAGQLLADKLESFTTKDTVLLAIPAGGVPVGFVIAKAFQIPLNLIILRKIKIPWNPEAGFGSVAPDGTVFLNEPLVKRLGLTKDEIERSAAETLNEIKRRQQQFGVEFPNVKDKTVVLVDDGLASGFTMIAAINFVKKYSSMVIVAVPTAPLGTVQRVAPLVDKLVCLNVRESWVFAVADAYQKWYDLNDDEVKGYLTKAAKNISSKIEKKREFTP